MREHRTPREWMAALSILLLVPLTMPRLACGGEAAPFIRQWLVVGPYAACDRIALLTDVLNGEKDCAPAAGDTAEGKAWRLLQSPADAVDLSPMFGTPKHAVAYAHVYMNTPVKDKAVLRLGTTNGVCAWMNGVRVWLHPACRQWQADQDRVVIELKPGWNRLLLKFESDEREWKFSARITAAGGGPIPLIYRAERPDRMSQRLAPAEGPARAAMVAARRNMHDWLEKTLRAIDEARQRVKGARRNLPEASDANINKWFACTARYFPVAAETLRKMESDAAGKPTSMIDYFRQVHQTSLRPACLGYAETSSLIDQLLAYNAKGIPCFAPEQRYVDFHRALCVRRQIAEHIYRVADLLSLEAVARGGIERYRKEKVTVKVVFPSGKPTRGAILRVRQTHCAFLFGCVYPDEGEMRLMARTNMFRSIFAQTFNYAVVERMADWRSVEREQGKMDLTQVDDIVRWCRSQNIEIGCPCLVWGEGPGWPGVPRWLATLPDASIRTAVKLRVQEMLKRYGDDVRRWTVVRSPLRAPWFSKRLGEGYLRKAFACAREAAPNAILCLSEGTLLKSPYALERTCGLVESLANAGLHVDAVVVEFSDSNSQWSSQHKVRETLDALARSGCAVEVSGLGAPSREKPIAGPSREGRWTEAAQAEYIHQLLMTCFGHPAVQAVVFRALWDSPSVPNGLGLLRADFSPKPAFRLLHAFIQREARTRLVLRTDARGQATFRAVCGEHEVTATFGSKKATARLKLIHGQPAVVRITLP